jgi:hypothetical protein
VDTAYSFNIDSNTRMSLGSSYSTPYASNSVSLGIDLLHSSPSLGGQSCNRFFFGHGSTNSDCWTGPANTRCVQGGGSCPGNHPKLQGVEFWIYIGTC